MTLLPASHKELIQWPNRAGCSFYGRHALGVHQGSKGHGLSALSAHRHHRFIPPLNRNTLYYITVALGKLRSLYWFEFSSLYTQRAHKSPCWPCPCASYSAVYHPMQRHICAERASSPPLWWRSFSRLQSFPGVSLRYKGIQGIEYFKHRFAVSHLSTGQQQTSPSVAI